MKVHTEGRPDSCTAIFLYINAMKHFITIMIRIQGAECVPRTLFQPLGVRVVAPASISLAADIVGQCFFSKVRDVLSRNVPCHARDQCKSVHQEACVESRVQAST